VSNPFFNDGKVKKMGDIPDAWLWSVLRPICDKGIDIKVIDISHDKSNTHFRNAIYHVTGLDKKVAVCAELLEQVVMKHVIIQLIKWRGDLLNKNGGLFTDGLDPDTHLVRYDVGRHGIYSLVAKDKLGGENVMALHVQISTQKLQFRAHPNISIYVSTYMSFVTVYKNWAGVSVSES
jgi:hypothetical protein